MLEIAKACNFRCSYCFADYLATVGNRQKEVIMGIGVAKIAVDSLIQNCYRNGLPQAEICFMGGEPFLNWVVMEEILEYSDCLAKKNARIGF